MTTRLVTVQGQIVGRRVPTDRALGVELVVRVVRANGDGPEADSIVLVAVPREGVPRARYLSWIVGYGDLDQAQELEPARLTIIEPAEAYEATVAWQPFGWGPLELVWTHPPLRERRAAVTGRNGKANGAFDRAHPRRGGGVAGSPRQ